MPYNIIKNPDGTYKVVSKDSGKVHAKKTSKSKAKAQMRVMYEAEHGEKAKKRAKSKGGTKGKSKVPAGFHRMSDGKIMKNSAMQHNPQEILKGFMGG